MFGTEILGLATASGTLAGYLLWSLVLLTGLAIGIGLHSELQHQRQRATKRRRLSNARRRHGHRVSARAAGRDQRAGRR